MTHLKSIYFALLCILSPAVFSSEPVILNVPQVIQEQSQWCWAATSKSILDYYGIFTTQEEIARVGTQGENIWNWLYGESQSPTRTGVESILKNWGIPTEKGAFTLSLDEIHQEIHDGHPFIFRWGWDEGGGHFITVKGIQDSSLYMMDPWFGRGNTVNEYKWVVRGANHTWTHTLMTRATPPTLKTISGYVHLNGQHQVAAVGIDTVYTDDDGYYSLKVNHGWSGSVTVLNPEQYLQPTQISFSYISENQTSQNFNVIELQESAQDDNIITYDYREQMVFVKNNLSQSFQCNQWLKPLLGDLYLVDIISNSMTDSMNLNLTFDQHHNNVHTKLIYRGKNENGENHFTSTLYLPFLDKEADNLIALKFSLKINQEIIFYPSEGESIETILSPLSCSDPKSDPSPSAPGSQYHSLDFYHFREGNKDPGFTAYFEGKTLILNSKESISHVEIFSITGQFLARKSFSNSPQNIEINLSNLKPGIYYNRVKTKQGWSRQMLMAR